MPTELSILIEAAMIGGGMGIVGVTLTLTFPVPVFPVFGSLTTSITGKISLVVYAWIVSHDEADILPSPYVQEYTRGVGYEHTLFLNLILVPIGDAADGSGNICAHSVRSVVGVVTELSNIDIVTWLGCATGTWDIGSNTLSVTSQPETALLILFHGNDNPVQVTIWVVPIFWAVQVYSHHVPVVTKGTSEKFSHTLNLGL